MEFPSSQNHLKTAGIPGVFCVFLLNRLSDLDGSGISRLREELRRIPDT